MNEAIQEIATVESYQLGAQQHVELRQQINELQHSPKPFHLYC